MQSRFISAGINLTRSGAIDFGHRKIDGTGNEDETLPIYFGDFLNYWIVFDLLSSLELYVSNAEGKIADELGIRGDRASLNAFALVVSKLRCWFGYLEGADSYESLKNAISQRISVILAFLNFNIDELPPKITRSKTTIGEPIAQVAQALHSMSVVPADVHLFVRIDQYEELLRLEGRHKTLGPLYREIVNKALSLRDPNVSYRIGTRGYAWDEHPRVYGTAGNLERDRNFKMVDLDELLRRRENRKTWIFPEFAEDVFRRRLTYADYDLPSGRSPLETVFGDGGKPEEKAKSYCGKSPERALRFEPSWPEAWKQYLKTLAADNPLSARFGEAWARQKGKGGVITNIPAGTPVWEQDKNKYWRKERIEAALMQIAGRCGQRMFWFGVDDVLALSGGNVLVFVSLCQHIWASWLRTQRGRELSSSTQLPCFDSVVQTVGIQEASSHWYNKLAEETGGSTRQRFVTRVANVLERKLYKDDSLSYPGANGFSIELLALSRFQELETLLKECVDYGALVDGPHTTKDASRRPRRKWYLAAILSPHFRLPPVHTKEPAYVTSEEVLRWFNESRAVSSGLVETEKNVEALAQRTLFGENAN
jgi:hypothetical protein